MTVAIGILKDQDPVSGAARFLAIIHRLEHPHPTAIVDVDTDWAGNLFGTCVQGSLEARRHGKAVERLGRPSGRRRQGDEQCYDWEFHFLSLFFFGASTSSQFWPVRSSDAVPYSWPSKLAFVLACQSRN